MVFARHSKGELRRSTLHVGMLSLRRRRHVRNLMLCAVCISAVATFMGDVFYRVTSVHVPGSSSGPNARIVGRGDEHFLATWQAEDVLFIEPFHGLGNRLRAYASAAALAKKSGRSLVVVWIPDVHLGANFTDLFEVPAGVVVFHFPILSSLLQNNHRLLTYDYNSEGGKDEILRDRSRSAIYVRSAYVLQSETKVIEGDIVEELKALKPVTSVTRRARQGSAHLAGLEDVIGVHIRMQTDLDRDVPGISKLPSYHAAGTASMGPYKHHRSRCHYNEFIPKLTQALKENHETVFLVSTDSHEAVDALRKVFGQRVQTLRGKRPDCSGVLARSASCVQEALAQFLALSQVSSSFILSEWSSSSELIQRLGSPTPYTFGCAQEKMSRLSPAHLTWLVHRFVSTD